MRIELDITRSAEIARTPRVMQVEGIFDVAPAGKSITTWHHDIELPSDWNIGVVVGPSGCGKTTFASEAFGRQLVAGWQWPAEKSVLDGFPAGMGIADITGLLSSVGFSSPPSWLRPFQALSNGEQFRVNLARTLAEQPELAVVDEFTSVVDRTVAQVGSAAVAKTVRRRSQRFVAVTCHYDVLDWLEPDWVYEPHTGKLARGRLRRRPDISLRIDRTTPAAWELFSRHHYLSANIHRGASCYVAYVGGQLAAFVAMLFFPHPHAPAWRVHRIVTLPDFQGVGIGTAMLDYVAGLYAASGKRVTIITTHPGLVASLRRSKDWTVTRKGSFASSRHKGVPGMTKHTATARLTWGFRFVGSPCPADARRFGLNVRGQTPPATPHAAETGG